MQPLVKRTLREVPIQLIGIGLLMASIYLSVMDDWDDSIFDLLFAYPLGIAVLALILIYVLATVGLTLLECLRFHWAEVDERPYEPLLQSILWYKLQKILNWFYLGIIIFGSLWLMSLSGH